MPIEVEVKRGLFREGSSIRLTKPNAVFHKSHLLKLRVAPSETAMNDVLREVSIMKMLGHPNIVNLIEVINDPLSDHFYMVLEYVEGKLECEGSGPGGIGESKSRRYLRDVVAGLLYLHAHVIIFSLFSSPGLTGILESKYFLSNWYQSIVLGPSAAEILKFQWIIWASGSSLEFLEKKDDRAEG
ncbi:hypothetical protein IEQ34_001476 [Dendrobium chrysotoxum]|uniref:Protein kinase domain-containing protein n=1 Tax=Dendrobium chrysotoxum TaxID=161865 RepID=A0AAV7HP93_DENCH|nr:hypothetical protein IEQ34_001476 [Dendrobium chrysotoxum]